MAISQAKHWLKKIHRLCANEENAAAIKIMNVCGGHERTISQHGLRTLLPEQVELIAGPGCPVCVCPEQDIIHAIQIAMDAKATVVAFGDMLRVPVNLSKTQCRSLEQARAAGADIRAIASPLEAVVIAKQQPKKTVVFFAAGFETTMAPVASMLLEGVPDNLSLLLSGRQTWPVVQQLLASDQANFDALIAPGHVSAIMGAEQWQFVVDQYKLPVAVAGFDAETLLQGFYSVIRQHFEKRLFLDNCYRTVVHSGGNLQAQTLLNEAMDCVDSHWRGLGVIEKSGYELKPSFDQHNARKLFPLVARKIEKLEREMPAGCDCADVVMGKIKPVQCRLYGKACTPEKPVGPCMVSDEGACHIWWSSSEHLQSIQATSNR